MSCRAVPYRAVSYLTVPYRVVPCRAIPCRAVPCRAVPCSVVPCRAVPCRTLPYRAVLHRDMSCRAGAGRTKGGTPAMAPTAVNVTRIRPSDRHREIRAGAAPDRDGKGDGWMAGRGGAACVQCRLLSPVRHTVAEPPLSFAGITSPRRKSRSDGGDDLGRAKLAAVRH